jgi:hypothetical protein
MKRIDLECLLNIYVRAQLNIKKIGFSNAIFLYNHMLICMDVLLVSV